jgi:hypothetical protein
VEIVEKSKVGLSPDSHNAWEPTQKRGFPHSPTTAAAGTIKANAAGPLESRGFTNSRAEPKNVSYSCLDASLTIRAAAWFTSSVVWPGL